MLAFTEHLQNGTFQIRFDNGAVSQVTFSLCRFFGENVAVIRVMSLDFSGAGQSESFLDSGFRFNFWHFFKFLKFILRACRILFFVRFGADHHGHVLAKQCRQLVHLAHLFELLGETEQEQLALILVDDGTTPEGHHQLHLVTVLQELDGMIALEIEIMIVRLRTHVNLLHRGFGTVGLDFLRLLLLLVEVFLVIHHLAYRRIGLWGNLHQVQLVLVGNGKCLSQGNNLGFEILTHHAHGLGCNVIVDTVLGFFLRARTVLPHPSACIRCNIQGSFLLKKYNNFIYKFLGRKNTLFFIYSKFRVIFLFLQRYTTLLSDNIW